MDKWREHIVVGLASVDWMDEQMLVSIVCERTMEGGSLASWTSKLPSHCTCMYLNALNPS